MLVQGRSIKDLAEAVKNLYSFNASSDHLALKKLLVGTNILSKVNNRTKYKTNLRSSQLGPDLANPDRDFQIPRKLQSRLLITAWRLLAIWIAILSPLWDFKNIKCMN